MKRLLSFLFATFFSWASFAASSKECAEQIAWLLNLLSVEEVHQLQAKLQNAQAITEEIMTALGAESFYFGEGAVRGITGDFVHVVTTPEGVLILLGDGNGHGLQAANDSVKLQSLLQTDQNHDGIPDAIQDDVSPTAALSRLNARAAEYLAKEATDDEGLIAMQAVSMDRKGNIVLANSGMPVGHIVRKNGTVEPLIAGGAMLGQFDAETFPAVSGEKVTGKLESGDKLVLMSDGITDREERTLDMLPFLTAVAKGRSSCETFGSAFLQSLPRYTHDDATLLVIEWP